MFSVSELWIRKHVRETQRQHFSDGGQPRHRSGAGQQLGETPGEEGHIYACCRDPQGPGAQALRDLSTQCPGKITVVKLDVSDVDSISSAVQTVSRIIGAGGLNLLINNAAINRPENPAPLSACGKKDMMEAYETNVVGPFLLVKMLLPLLQKAAEMDSTLKGDKMSCSRSAVVNISTLISSIEKCPETFHRTDAALNMLTRCLAEDFRRHNILVTAVHPGWVRTAMGGKRTAWGDAQYPDITQQQTLWDAPGLGGQHNPLVAVTMTTTV
ncbi:hypothetical protein F7725_022229 [Dissostichus mawsoni]|uniref:C-factor-like n=1 Tax=Dissostichus mawsoni TaxID=36200 RepID=A0A7J5YX49_DISMA|nr:hypothetical protein F7725_022229 [Dissostichus mawsoni]